MKLIFTGDVNFRNMDDMNEQKASEILEKVLPYTEQADFRIINLEEPLADRKISLEVVPYNYYLGNKINIFEGEDKKKMMAYLDRISAIIQDPEELHRYYMGWCCCYRSFPKPVEEYGGLKGTFAATKNLLSCEAHCNKLRENYRIPNDGDEDIACEYEIKAKELMKMPV